MRYHKEEDERHLLNYTVNKISQRHLHLPHPAFLLLHEPLEYHVFGTMSNSLPPVSQRGGYPTSVLWRVRSWTFPADTFSPCKCFYFSRGPSQETHTEPTTSCQATHLQKPLCRQSPEANRFKVWSKQVISPVSIIHMLTGGAVSDTQELSGSLLRTVIIYLLSDYHCFISLIFISCLLSAVMLKRSFCVVKDKFVFLVFMCAHCLVFAEIWQI